MLGLPDLLWPESCAGCNRTARSGLCRTCWEGLSRIGTDVWSYCGRPGHRPVERCRDCRAGRLHFDIARQAVIFGPVVRKAIHRFKYSGCRSLAAPLAELIGELLNPHAASTDAVTWISPGPNRLRRTGTDHGAVLASLVAAQLGRPAVPMICRVRSTPPQMRLDPEARRTNLIGAFRATICPPEQVLVVDDVFTTGSTASEIARALKAAGATRVVVLTVARSFPSEGADYN